MPPRRYRFVFFTLLLFLAAPAARAQYTCTPDVCRLPDCHCASVEPPAGLSPFDTPQFILVTFDDAVHAYSELLIGTFMQGLYNPDGRPVRSTYFVNVTNTDPAVLRQVYDAGHEIANHTATHTTSNDTPAWAWRQETNELDAYLRQRIGIPAGEVTGFRAPYLATNEALWQVLGEEGFLYESSIPEQITIPPYVSQGLDAYVWPHTLDYGAALSCYANHCPDAPVPGLWTIPMWAWMGQDGNNYGAMDPAAGLTGKFDHLLAYNFDSRYAGNRAPLGIFLHAGQMWQEERQQALRTFLQDRLTRPDVWLITMRGMIEWMRDPVPNDRMADWFARDCHRGRCRTSNVAIEEAPTDVAAQATLYPNPTVGDAMLTYTMPTPGPVTLEVIDLLGRVVYTEQRTASAGNATFRLPLSGQPPGAYLYRLSATGRPLAQGVAVRR